MPLIEVVHEQEDKKCARRMYNTLYCLRSAFNNLRKLKQHWGVNPMKELADSRLILSLDQPPVFVVSKEELWYATTIDGSNFKRSFM